MLHSALVRVLRDPEIMGEMRRRLTARSRDVGHITPESRRGLLRQDDILSVDDPLTLEMATEPRADPDTPAPDPFVKCARRLLRWYRVD